MNAQSVVGHNSRNKIAHLTSVHSPFDVRIFHKECKSLVRAGYEVTLIACHEKDETREGVRIRAVPKAAGRLSRMIRVVCSVYREAVRLNADLYHFHDPELLPVGLLLRMRGKVVVYDVHEDVSADVARKHYIPRGLRRFSASAVSLLETLAARFFSAVVPATPSISRRFASLRQPRVVVSNYPVLEEFHAAAPVAWTCRSPAIGYVGVLSRDRGIAEITQALSLLSPSFQVTLKLAGTFSPPSFREELAALNGWGQTQFLGTLDRAGVVDLLSEVRAGLVVLQPTPAFLDSVPIKMFEYMCAGIPVIASDFPGFAEIMNEERCGLLVDPHDPRTIAQAIEFVLAHPEEAEEMGRRGREAVMTKYNWAGEERKLIQLYRSLLDTPCVA